jgi:putative transposase
MARFEVIDANSAVRDPDGSLRYTITQMCTWLGVSTSGFHEWRSRPASVTATRREALSVLVVKAFSDSGGVYGYRRVHAQLARWGQHCSPGLVRDLMRAAGLVPCQPTRSRKGTTRQDGKAAPIPDLVGRDFTATVPGAKLVGDITYIHTWEGWLYLALVIDCHTRKIVGYATAEHYKTSLITAAVTMAATNLDLPHGAIFHSDRGSNYTSAEYAAILDTLGIRQSVGRTGICYDNALSESVNGAVKVELINRQEWPTREYATREVARYIELFYNTRRLHSGIGYRTPQEVMNDYNNTPTAA